MSKQVKQMLIDDIESRLGDTRDFLVVDSSRLDANTANRFRLAIQESNITALTVRNSLARLALKNLGVEDLEGLLEGPTTLVWGSEDVVALSKEIAKWAKEVGELEIKGASIEGQALDAAAVEALSKSPGRLELIGQIAGLALSPGGNIAAALLGPARKVAGQVKTISDGGDEGE